jgi:uncharacterized protein (DUF58 family)
MNIKEIERVAASLQTKIFKSSKSQSLGVMRTRFRGSGLQFREHQIYSPGDDVRFIDWKLSARSGHTYIKTFEEDRNVEIVCVVDVNPNLFYGSQKITKLQVILEIIALLLLTSKDTQDKVRVILVGKNKISEIPPICGHEGLYSFIKLLEKESLLKEGQPDFKSSQKLTATSFNELFTTLNFYLSKKKEVLLFTDHFQKYREHEKFVKIRKQLHFYGVEVLSPVDLENSWFGLPTKGGHIQTSRSYKTFKSRNIIQLRTDEKYLDVFLNKMREV